MVICGSLNYIFNLCCLLLFYYRRFRVYECFYRWWTRIWSLSFGIYGNEVLKFLTYVVPLALFQYYPLLYLLDIEQGLKFMMAPVFSLLFLLPAYAFWRYGLSKYVSTGS